MKKILIIALFFTIMPPAMASVLFDGWINNGETFKAGEHDFYAEYVSSIQKLNFKMDGIGGILLVGECETKDNIKYCFEDVEYPQIKVKIAYLEPDIEIQRTFSATSPLVKEAVTVKVVLKNNGDKSATQVKFKEIYPLGLKTATSNNIISWEGNIGAGEEETFEYTLIPEEVLSYDSAAEVSYKHEGQEKTKKSSSQKIEVKKPFSIENTLSSEAVEKEELAAYNLTIENKDESNRLVISRLEIDVPSQLTIVSVSEGLKREGSKLIFQGEIDKKKVKSFIVTVKSFRVGKFVVHSSALIKLAGISFAEELEKSFSVELSNIVPILEVPATVRSGSSYTAYIAAKNYGKKEIKNAEIMVDTGLFGVSKQKIDIKAGDTYEIFKKTLTAPYAAEDTAYNISVYGSYNSPSGKSYTFEKSARVIVIAANKTVQIVKEFSKEEIYPGDKIDVNVKVINQKDTPIESIDVSDTFPEEIRFSLAGNVTGYIEKLNSNEEKEAYSYSLIIPNDYKEDGIEFRTTINAKIDGEPAIIEREDNIKVIREENRSIEEKEMEPAQKDDMAEGMPKESIFSKLINLIKNLFKRE